MFSDDAVQVCGLAKVYIVRILIIEDDVKVGRTLIKGLEADHFAVDLSNDGEDGLQLATEIDYDALIVDWNLPKVDGLTLVRKLRKSGSPARVLFLSARNEVSDRVTALQAGADDFLVKPFAFEELRMRIHTLLRRPQELLDKITVADLELDRMRHTVTRAGKLIALTQREYAVLEYLMRNAQRTVTRTMVVEHVWNLGFEGLTNIVDVYINYLRAKIDHGFSQQLIHTIRGVGYSITANEPGAVLPGVEQNAGQDSSAIVSPLAYALSAKR
jgi:DNA-binding response OmpR family regulator